MATTNWTGAVNNNWNTAGNWSAGIPAAGDTAQFLAGPVTVNVTSAATVADSISVTLAAGVALTLTSSGAGSLDCTGAFGLTFVLDAGSSANVSALIIGSGGVEAAGIGAGGTLFLAGANTFTGGVQLNNSLGSVVVHGLVLGGFGSTSNTILVRSSTTLNLNSLAFTNPITYAGGTIAFPSLYAGVITLSGATLTIGTNVTADVDGAIVVPVGTTLNLNSLDIPAVVIASGGSILNAGAYTGTPEASAGATILTASFPSATEFIADGGTVNGGGTNYLASPILFKVTGGGVLTNATLNPTNVTAESGTISAVLGGAGALAKTTAGTVTLSAANTHAGGVNVQAGTVAATNVAALGSGTTTLGVVAGSQGSVNLGGLAIPNAILANTGVVLGGAAYGGTMSVPALGVAEIAAGNSLGGTANVAPTGRLKVLAPQTGTVNNDGEVEVDSGAGGTPLSTYNGTCGSTYLRAA